jgi:cation diffusion facilitator family transporter
MQKKQQKDNRKAILISLVVGVILMSIKFFAYYLTKSSAILTDASESIVNVIAAAFAGYSIYLTNLPKDENHPYGHGKIEFFSAGLEGILIIIAGVLTLVPSVWGIFSHKEIENIDNGIYLIIFTILINAGLGFYLVKTGKKSNSIVLEADGKHLLVDSVSSVILLIGLFIIKFTGLYFIDSVLGIFLAIYIIINGYQITRKSVAGLMDEIDHIKLANIIEILNKNRRKTWIDVHNLRVQQYGADVHIDCHITLPYYMTLEESHQEVTDFEQMLNENYENNVEIFIHSDPCLPKCCSYCMVDDCKVRRYEFEKSVIWNKKTLMNDHKHDLY